MKIEKTNDKWTNCSECGNEPVYVKITLMKYVFRVCKKCAYELWFDLNDLQVDGELNEMGSFGWFDSIHITAEGIMLQIDNFQIPLWWDGLKQHIAPNSYSYDLSYYLKKEGEQ